MRKIIFLDVDGTLINYKAELPSSAKMAVDLARKNGHLVYICTGCSKFEVLDRHLPEIDGMILANGGYVESHEEIILHQPISLLDEMAVVNWCKERNLGIVLESNQGMFADDVYKIQGEDAIRNYISGKTIGSEVSQQQVDNIMKTYTFLKNDQLYRNDINKISFVLSSYQDHLDSQKHFPNLIAHTWGGKDEMALFGDLAPQGITKRTAIEVLLKYLNADVKDTIAFGDAKIDLTMFELCNYSVAMGNGSDEIKAAADYITDDVDHDGLWNAFKYLKLI